MVKWIPAENGGTIGQLGTENGVILKDEEWPHTGRITLEEDREKASITCGLYGTFFHTAYTSVENGSQLYARMKAALEDSPDDLEPLMDWCAWFVHEFQ
ncbi:hypothetical protein [Levilactobacillus enshiensis]|uniref:hypothetical protein n=1 Tax=Levilactobacillus enshiensis TaxID=2590213 RepID=UPI00117BA406|nr:hypothetical protein [Levilactobacillus enshiensis]